MFCSFFKAQKRYNLDYGVMTGVSNYLGEIGGREKAARPFLADLKLAKTRWNETAFIRYKFHPQFSVKGAFNYLRIEGDDKLTTNPGRRYRNLNFRSDIFDLETTINWIIYNSIKPSGIYRRTNVYFTAYLFTGAGIFYHNPKAFYQDEWIALQPLKTEGQTKGYSHIGFCVPVGGGFYFTILKGRRAHRLGLELNWRYTSTDYLDDISSKSWLNPASPNASNQSVALNNRNPELGSKQPDNFALNYGWRDDGSGNNQNKAPRGDPSKKDSYISFNLSYSTAIKGRFHRSKGRKIRAVTF
jgi:hypothetical protein